MIQGLLCVRQYFQKGNEEEKALAARIDKLWKEVNLTGTAMVKMFCTGIGVLIMSWKMNFAVRGYNECLIMYVLAASSPTHGVPAEVYHEGWAENGKINKFTANMAELLYKCITRVKP